jgi:hypothetical protein
VTNLLPPSVSFISAATTGGTFSQTGSTTVCNLGMLLPGFGATVTVVGFPTVAGTVTNLALAGENEPDANPPDNTASATAQVNDRVLITTQPASQTVTNGTSATFSVVASGTGTLLYQWQWYGTNLAGRTASSLTLANVQTVNAGPYDVIVQDSISYAISSNAFLTVLVTPSITNQPASQTAPLGGSAIFSVGAAGTLPLGYQWYFNTTNLLSDATAATLTLNNLTTNNAGNYTVVVTNVAGGVTSSVAALTVSPMNFGTAPDPPYPTYLTNNGARHVVVSTANLRQTLPATRAGMASPSPIRWWPAKASG